MPEKVWKSEPLTFGQFEDLWEQNNKLEVAKSLLMMLKDSKSIPDGLKLIFLAKQSEYLIITPAYFHGFRDTPEDRELGVIAVRFFLEIVPRWDNDAFKEEYETTILKALGNLPAGAHRGWESKIKAFIHSLLDIEKKKENTFWLYVIPKALINNGMFEELVNYDFTSDSAICELATFLFPKHFSFRSQIALKGEMDNLFQQIYGALRENYEPHATSVLLRLLAKRGDLDKIFLEKEKVEPVRINPVRVISQT